MTADRRRSRSIDIAEMQRLWPTFLTDKEIAARLGHGRGALRRAAERIGLPPRYVARRQAFKEGSAV